MEVKHSDVSNWLNVSLNKNDILIKDTKKRRVYKKIKRLINCGFGSLQIISDLDRTLTTSTIDLLTKNPLLPEWYKLKALERRKQWAAVESNSKLRILEKIQAIEQLSKIGQEDLLKCNITKESMKEIFQAAEAKMPKFREFTFEALNLLHKHKVPVSIISAGWGDAQLAVLKYNDFEYENVQLIANYLQFENDNVTMKTASYTAVGFIPPLIHMYNKHCAKLDCNTNEIRTTVILLGDLIPDIQMASKIAQKNAVLLKIGFINDENASKERIDSYLNAFDIVIWKDESMKFFYDLIKFMKV